MDLFDFERGEGFDRVVIFLLDLIELLRCLLLAGSAADDALILPSKRVTLYGFSYLRQRVLFGGGQLEVDDVVAGGHDLPHWGFLPLWIRRGLIVAE